MSPPDVGGPWSTLAEMLRRRAEEHPGRLAYRFLADGETVSDELTYGELDERARAVAAELQRYGATGERALLLYPPGLDFVVAFFACAYAGAVAVPTHPPRPRRPDPRARQILVDSRAAFALTTRELLAQAKARLADGGALPDFQWLATNEVPAQLADDWRHPATDEDDLALLQYTSGSTSTPKGVMVSHGNMLRHFRDVCRVEWHDEVSVMLSWLPHLHDMGLIYGILQSPFVGCSCVLMSPAAFLQRPARWLEAITRYEATHSGGPNFAYDLCVRRIKAEELPTLDLSSWMVALNGAEPVRSQTIRAFSQAFEPAGFRAGAFRPSYGLAEATLMVTARARKGEPILCETGAGLESEDLKLVRFSEGEAEASYTVSCGCTVGDTEVAIVDPHSLARCPGDSVGEIWVSGGTIARGYWNRPEETRETFEAYTEDGTGGPYLRTGDLGFVRDGELFITGRLKDLIIIRGVNHYPQDIELTSEASHPGLRPYAAAAFAVDMDGEDRLVVIQEVERVHRSPDVEALTSAIRREVAEAHDVRPDAVVLVKHGSIPRTTSGKVQRHACRRHFMEGTLRVLGEWRAPEAAESPSEEAEREGSLRSTILGASGGRRRELLETHVCRQVARVLKIPLAKLDTEEPLNHLGIDSLMAVELKNRIEGPLAVSLPLIHLIEGPSISQVTTLILDELEGTTRDGAAEEPPAEERSASMSRSMLLSLLSLTEEDDGSRSGAG